MLQITLRRIFEDVDVTSIELIAEGKKRMMPFFWNALFHKFEVNSMYSIEAVFGYITTKIGVDDDIINSIYNTS